jgi:hypothetical protein
MYEYRCDERLNTKTEGSTRLGYTGFRGGLEHLKIETRLIDDVTLHQWGGTFGGFWIQPFDII